MTPFEKNVLENDPSDRQAIIKWLEAALRAIDPEVLTREALSATGVTKAAVIAIGKAAPAMVRGASQALSVAGGVCVSEHEEVLPPNVTSMTGEHPIPGEGSRKAGEAVLQFAEGAPKDVPLIALISGGGSSLCEMPREGVPPEFVAKVNARLLSTGLDIERMNLVRSHLSAVKCGGLARAARRPIDTFVISDVAGGDPAIIASGPTIPREADPDRATEILEGLDLEIPDTVKQAMSAQFEAMPSPRITLLADAHDAAQAIAATTDLDCEIRSEWLRGDLMENLPAFLARASAEISIAIGEPTLAVQGEGRGGRNTHAALIAAQHLAGTNDVFVSFATDGVDGRSGAAGAMVDGKTVARGGSPAPALSAFDSATYLTRTGDLIKCDPTSTNVSDIWILWRRTPRSTVE